MKRVLLTVLALFLCVIALVSCKKDNPATGSYEFVIYAPDDDCTVISDNRVVVKYTITYTDETYVLDSLILKDGKYYFEENGTDYIQVSGGFITGAHFEAYTESFDATYTMTYANGEQAQTGIDQVALEGLTSFGFVIDGWYHAGF